MTISKNTADLSFEKKKGYAPVNGLRMYYEMQGTGKPLVYLGMGLSAVGYVSFPTLNRVREVISIDLQGRGRTADIDRPLDFRQQAEDVISLMDHLRIQEADFLGECVGGIVAMLVMIYHPDRVGRVVTYGTTFGKFQESYRPEILEGVFSVTPDSCVLEFQRTNYLNVAPDPAHWPAIWQKFGQQPWNGFSTEELGSVKKPVLIAVGDNDWVRLDHVLDIYRQIPGADLAVIPDAGHFILYEEQEKLMPAVEAFLDAPRARLPYATTRVAYAPGVSR